MRLLRSWTVPPLSIEDPPTITSLSLIAFDSSNHTAAAIEDVTLAPALDNVPSPDCGTNDLNETPPFIAPGCAREDLIAFINGQTGRDNVQRQGENVAILDHESPLNILEDVPNNGGQFNYSPMWDIHFLQWDASVPIASRLRQTDFARTGTGRHPGPEHHAIRYRQRHLPVDRVHRELPARQHLRQQLALSFQRGWWAEQRA